MFRFLADENFNADIVRGLLLRQPTLEIVRVQEIGLAGADDPGVLAKAADEHRIVLTHDRSTLPDYAYERLASGEAMSGVFVFNDRFPVGQTIQEILLVIECSDQEEWNGRVVYLPL